MVVTRGNALQIVQNQANLRENIRLCVLCGNMFKL